MGTAQLQVPRRGAVLASRPPNLAQQRSTTWAPACKIWSVTTFPSTGGNPTSEPLASTQASSCFHAEDWDGDTVTPWGSAGWGQTHSKSGGAGGSGKPRGTLTTETAVITVTRPTCPELLASKILLLLLSPPPHTMFPGGWLGKGVQSPLPHPSSAQDSGPPEASASGGGRQAT